ncbi:MAG: TIGR03663 family protein [Verrucomicrobia bacterium]|nr:TIGR03663 family protein [Verrucomicrobiota bacterium]
MNRWFAPGLFLLICLALAFRLPQLDRRPMHNDEGLNAMKFRSLWVTNDYKYDPHEFHGPTLPYATLPAAWLSPARNFDDFTESTFRLVTVAFGIGLILLVLLLTDGLGKPETLCAVALTAISPAMVFYSRYYIHEMLLVFFTALTLGAGWRYWQTKSLGWCLLAGAGLALMFATKETFVLSAGCLVLAVLGNLLWSRWVDGHRSEIKGHLNFKHIAAAFVVALLVSVVLFTSFFTNASGPLDSLRTYLPWLNRAGGESPHIYPWDFYLRRLIFFHYPNGPIWTEALIVGLAVIGFVCALTRRWLGQTNGALVRVLAFYTAGLTLSYTLISYKTPWCLLNFLYGMILLAGVGAIALLRACKLPGLKWTTAAVLLAASGQLGWQAWRAGFPDCASQFNPYVYAQTSPNVVELINKIEAIARVSPQGHDTVIKVISSQESYWPLPWYLRRFNKVGWWDEMPKDPIAPIMLVSSGYEAKFDERPDKTHLMAGYFQLRPQVFFELYVELNLWRAYVKTLPPEKD